MKEKFDQDTDLIENVKLVNPINAKGRVTLTLTDADTGEVVENIEKDNFISRGVYEAMELQMKNLIQRRVSTGSNRNDGVADPFSMMYLTDADHEEKPDSEWLIKGKLIGESYTTQSRYTNNAELSGMLNSEESFVDEDQVRMVVDFPAEAANGDINSVYFAPDHRMFTNILSKSTNNTNRSGITKYRDRYYVNVKGTVINVGDRDGVYGIDVLDENFNILESYSFTGWPYIHDMTVYDEHIYGITYHNTSRLNRGIVKIPINDIDGFVNNPTDYYIFYNSSNNDPALDLAGNSRVRINGITYMPDRQQFAILWSQLSMNTPSIIFIYDTEFNLLDSITADFNFSYSSDGGGVNSYNAVLVYDDGMFVHERGCLDVSTKNTLPRGDKVRIGGVDENFIFTADGIHQPKFGFASRARLGSTVTKTSRYNMKVVYDFMLPSIYPSLI